MAHGAAYAHADDSGGPDVERTAAGERSDPAPSIDEGSDRSATPAYADDDGPTADSSTQPEDGDEEGGQPNDSDGVVDPAVIDPAVNEEPSVGAESPTPGPDSDEEVEPAVADVPTDPTATATQNHRSDSTPSVVPDTELEPLREELTDSEIEPGRPTAAPAPEQASVTALTENRTYRTETSPQSTISALSPPSTTAASLPTAPVTVKNIFSDVLTWIGLGNVAAGVPVPNSPVPSFIASMWLAVRENQYRWNNQRPTAKPTVTKVDPLTGVVTGRLNAVDYEGDQLTYTVTGMADHGTVVIDSAGNFTYTPDTEYAVTGGLDSFTVMLDDRPGNPPHSYGLLGMLGLLGPAKTSISVTVRPLGAPPVAGTPAYGWVLDPSTGEVIGTINASDPDGDVLHYKLAEPVNTAIGTVDIDRVSGKWTFTPTITAREIAQGTPDADAVAFHVVVTDGRSTITIEAAAPIAALALPAGTVKRDPVTGDIAVKAAETTTAYDWAGFNPSTGSYGMSDAQTAGWTTLWIGGGAAGGLPTGRPSYGAGAVKIDAATGDIAIRSDPLSRAGEWFVVTPTQGGYYASTATVATWHDVYAPGAGTANSAPVIVGHGDGWIDVRDNDGDPLSVKATTPPLYGTVTVDSFEPVEGRDGVYRLTYTYHALTGKGAVYAYADKPTTDTFTFGFADGTDSAIAAPVIVDVGAPPASLPSLTDTVTLGDVIIDATRGVAYQTVRDTKTSRSYIIVARGDAAPVAVQLEGQAAAGAVLDQTTGNLYQTTVAVTGAGPTVVVSVVDAAGVFVATHRVDGIPIGSATADAAAAAQVVIHDGYAYQSVAVVPTANPAPSPARMLTAALTAAPAGGHVLVINLAQPNGPAVVVDTPGIPGRVQLIGTTRYVVSSAIDTSGPTPVLGGTYVTVFPGANPRAATHTPALPGLSSAAYLGGSDPIGIVGGNPYIVTSDPVTGKAYVTVVDRNNAATATPREIPGRGAAVLNDGTRLFVLSAVPTGASSADTVVTVIGADGKAVSTSAFAGAAIKPVLGNGRLYLVLHEAERSRVLVVDPASPTAATPVDLPAAFTPLNFELIGAKMVLYGPDTEAGRWTFVVADPGKQTLSQAMPVPGGPTQKIIVHNGRVYVITTGFSDPEDAESGFATWVTRIDPQEEYSATVKVANESLVGDPTVEGGKAVFLTSPMDGSSTPPSLWSFDFDKLSAESLANGDKGVEVGGAYSAPTSMADLYTHLRDVTADMQGDGMYVELVETADGPRYIVYLGGTSSAWFRGNQPILANPGVYFGDAKPQHLARLDKLTNDNPDVPIMLVGYSQGGMDAQRIAATGDYNVTAVVTYGSPLITDATGAYQVIHLQAEDDPVPKQFNNPLLVWPEKIKGHVYSARIPWRDFGDWLADPSGVGLHGDRATYVHVGREWQRLNAGSDALLEIQRYQGPVNRYYSFGHNPDLPEF